MTARDDEHFILSAPKLIEVETEIGTAVSTWSGTAIYPAVGV